MREPNSEQQDRITLEIDDEVPVVHTILATLIHWLDEGRLPDDDVIPWSSPVLSFGNVSTSKVATLGINPSNREFVDQAGAELQGVQRRFHTLTSLGLESWADADARHLRLILDTCNTYFLGNPYDAWFKRLDLVVKGTGASFYDSARNAVHLDLIPYATRVKWTELSTRSRAELLAESRDVFARLLRASQVNLLILNGRSVVWHFQEVTGAVLDQEEMPSWSLHRRAPGDVKGIAYFGRLDSINGVGLDREMLILGFNHNLQSSYGVTTRVVHAIRDWVAERAQDFNR